MFGRSFRIVTIGSIPVNVDASWIWIALLAVYTLWSRLVDRFVLLGDGAALAYAVFGAVLFFGAVFLHELAHAVAARIYDIRVEGITLVFFGGFTAARSDEKGPGASFVISALGPATSLVLGALFWWLSRMADTTDGPLEVLFGIVGVINVFMAVFNVLPGLPLDGGRMVQAIVWKITGDRRRGTRVAAWGGMGIGVLLFGAAVLAASRDDLFEAVWFGIIGMFIFQGARASEQQLGIVDKLASATVADAMDPPPPVVPADLSLSEVLDRYLRGHEEEAFPVVEPDGRVIGLISFSSSRDLGARDPLRPAREAIIPLANVLVAHPDERLDQVSTRLGTGRAAIVLRDGALVGAITGGGVYRWAARAS
ncbi:MAG: M50 family metallopeptidase [Actinomycetota bacterium]